jgi:hypothetical protein
MLVLLVRNVKGEIFDDAVPDNVLDDCADESTNDTNEDELLYFARVTNHYLHLVKASTSGYPSSRHAMQYPIILQIVVQTIICSKKRSFLNHCILPLVE